MGYKTQKSDNFDYALMPRLACLDHEDHGGGPINADGGAKQQRCRKDKTITMNTIVGRPTG